MHLSQSGDEHKRSSGFCAQASRVRFVFTDDSLEVLLGEEQEETENAFVGGENKWAFSTFTNWEYWWPGFPVLVYFKARSPPPRMRPCACLLHGMLPRDHALRAVRAQEGCCPVLVLHGRCAQSWRKLTRCVACAHAGDADKAGGPDPLLPHHLRRQEAV